MIILQSQDGLYSKASELHPQYLENSVGLLARAKLLHTNTSTSEAINIQPPTSQVEFQEEMENVVPKAAVEALRRHRHQKLEGTVLQMNWLRNQQ